MKHILVLLLAVFFMGCNSVEIPSDSESNDTEGTVSPVANAGDDITMELFDTVEIVGSGTNGDGTIIDYEWREDGVLISGLRTFTYLASEEGNFTLTLTVVDDNDLTDSDDMIITVTAESNTTEE